MNGRCCELGYWLVYELFPRDGTAILASLLYSTRICHINMIIVTCPPVSANEPMKQKYGISFSFCKTRKYYIITIINALVL